MRHSFQLDGLAELGPLAEPLDEPAIVDFEELPDGEHGEQLRLGELAGALGVRVVSQRILAGLQRRPPKRDWILSRP